MCVLRIGVHTFLIIFRVFLLLQKEQVVKEYENGKAIPNQQVLGKLERVLGVKLRGKK